MEIIGRLTADATVNTLKDGREVVNFSIAINDRFKAKDQQEVTKVVTYVNCSYWSKPAIAPHLLKGNIVELFGRIGVNTWTNMNGEARATLTFHVNTIKLHGGNNAIKKETTKPSTDEKEGVGEDLPF